MHSWWIAVVAAVVALCVPFTGCRLANVRILHGADGTEQLHITCFNDEGRCLEAAGDECPNGYDVINAHGGVEGGTVTIGPFGASASETRRYNLLIKCRWPAPASQAP